MNDPTTAAGITTIERPRPPALNVLNELSTGTYVSYGRALKEILSNAWDAGANDVQIKIAPDLSEITILDDGTGMSEQDIRERFLRLGGSSASRGAFRNDRRLIGHKGIGALSVIAICREVRVLTTQANSNERFEATLDITRILEKARQQEDLDPNYFYTQKRWDNEPLNTHYTFISLRDLTPDIKDFLAMKGVTTAEYISSVRDLSGLEQLKWELAMVSPVGYLKDGPFAEHLDPMVAIKRELARANFKVSLNGTPLLKPIVLPSPDIKYAQKYKRGLDYEIHAISHKSDDLEFSGYLFSQATAIMPSDLRGGLIRLNNVAIGTYDLNWLKYQKHVGPRLGMVTGEIYVTRGLDDALLIERDRFRETDASYRHFRELIHASLRDAFGGATSRSRTRATVEKQRHAESFRKQIGAKASQYLKRTTLREGVTLDLEHIGANKPPFVLDKRQGKIVLNSAHGVFKNLSAAEKEIVEAFIVAIGIGKERSAGDVERMIEEIFKIVTDLLGARKRA